jgi:hypothetical protein
MTNGLRVGGHSLVVCVSAMLRWSHCVLGGQVVESAVVCSWVVWVVVNAERPPHGVAFLVLLK